jgi:hypothetical protein
MSNTFTVERVISGSGRKFEQEVVAANVTLNEAILAYLKAFHTGHPTWILNDAENRRLHNCEIEHGLQELVNEVMV